MPPEEKYFITLIGQVIYYEKLLYHMYFIFITFLSYSQTFDQKIEDLINENLDENH